MRKVSRAAIVAMLGAGAVLAAWHGGQFDPRDDSRATRSSQDVQPGNGGTVVRPVRSAGPAAAAATAPNYYTLSAPVRFAPTVKNEYSDAFPIWVRVVAIGDVTGDNRDDVVLVVDTHEVWVLPQRSNGTIDWAAPQKYANVVSTPSAIALGDMNEDGILDIVVSGRRPEDGYQGGVSVLVADGNGGFTPRHHSSVELWRGVLADADLDGHLDAVGYFVRYESACLNGCIYRRIFHGNGTGGFSRETDERVDAGGHPQVADLNNDGVADLVGLRQLVTANGTVETDLRVWFNNRAGGYLAPVTIMPSVNAERTVFGDFNRDGMTDILQWYADGLGVHPQTSPGVFGSPLGPFVGYGLDPPNFLATDLDRDGATDLLVGAFITFQDQWLQTYLQLNGVMEATPERVRPGNNRSGEYPGGATGDINGDGCTDVIVALGQDGLDSMLGRGCRPARVARNDFDGDHASDLLWHDATTNASDAWRGASIDQRRIVATGGAAWKLAATGDIDGDGRSDMVWRNRDTGANLVWRAGNYRTTFPLTAISDAAWQIVGTGDFDGDRKADVLWRHATSGRNVYWAAGRSTSTVTLPTVTDQNWRAVAIGDFDGDGRDDLFWRHATNGRNALWKSATTSLAVVNVGLSWNIVGAGDFDGDGKSDLLWRSTTGGNLLWRSANAATQSALAAVTSTAWSVAAIGDYDDDGRADILWRESTGRNVIWLRGDGKRQRWVQSMARNFRPVP